MLAALELEQGRRASFVLDTCGDDFELAREVESLLREDVPEDDFLERPALDFTLG